MATQKIQYEANDGKLFDTEEAADAHNVALSAAKTVEDYITAAGLEKAQAGLMRKHLPQYQAFLETGTPPAREEKKAKPVVTPPKPVDPQQQTLED